MKQNNKSWYKKRTTLKILPSHKGKELCESSAVKNTEHTAFIMQLEEYNKKEFSAQIFHVIFSKTRKNKSLCFETAVIKKTIHNNPTKGRVKIKAINCEKLFSFIETIAQEDGTYTVTNILFFFSEKDQTMILSPTEKSDIHLEQKHKKAA